MTVGAIALSTGLVIRINNMSGWIMWVVNGIFENVGTVQDGITTISQPRTVQDHEGAMPLEVINGATDVGAVVNSLVDPRYVQAVVNKNLAEK